VYCSITASYTGVSEYSRPFCGSASGSNLPSVVDAIILSASRVQGHRPGQAYYFPSVGFRIRWVERLVKDERKMEYQGLSYAEVPHKNRRRRGPEDAQSTM